MRELDDGSLTELLGKIKTTDDLQSFGQVINDPEAGKAFAWHRRARNSVSAWLRSNALSPATGMFNAASAVINDFFRNDLSRTWAARAMAKEGNLPASELLRLKVQAGRSVYWEAHRRGLSAMLDRIKWEAWGDLHNILGVTEIGQKAAARATASRLAMLERGYRPPNLREFQERPTLTISPEELNARLGDIDGGSFATVLNSAARLGAATLNTVDALGKASMRLFTGAVDDYGRAFVQLKETYALAAEHAVDEGFTLGLSGDHLAAFVQHRSKELAEVPTAEIMSVVEQRLLKGERLSPEEQFLIRRDREAEQEAIAVQFQDGPQTLAGRKSAEFADMVDRAAGLGLVEGVLMPYIRTPIRLFETGLVEYTPFGYRADYIKAALAKGGPEAAVIRARMEIGLTVVGFGITAGLAGVISVTNGEFGNTRALDAGPANRLQIGNAYLEMSRLDPLDITLSIGGMIGQLLREGFQDANTYDVQTGINTALQVAMSGLQDSFLSKSYLTGLRDFNDVLFGRTAESSNEKVSKLLASVTQRLIPLAGTSRALNETGRDSAPETVTWADQMLRAIPGAGMYLPVRRDILGDPIKSRELGVGFGLSNRTGDGAEMDSVKATLRDLEINLQDLRRTDPAGFQLTAKQLDDLRRIRGTEAQNAEGATLREALQELFESDWFKELPERDQKKDAVAEVIRDFNEPARALLEDQDPAYHANRVGYSSFMDYMESGMSRSEARDSAMQDVAAEGLPQPDL